MEDKNKNLDDQINDLNLDLEFKDDVNKDIVDAYLSKDVELRNDIYESLLSDYPSLEHSIESAQEGNFVDKFVETESTLKTLRAMSPMVFILEAMVGEDEELKASLRVFERVDEFEILSKKYILMMKKKLVGLTRAVRELSHETNLEYAVLIELEEHRDSVERKLYPTRIEAESSAELDREYFMNVMIVARAMISLIRKVPGLDEADIDIEALNKISTIPAIRAFHEKSKEYDAKQFDRIYGTREN